VDVWELLREALGRFPAEAVAPPEGGRIGAALALLRDVGDGDLEIVYTRRRDDLRSHPGQVSFPGGRVDRGETVDEAAVREAFEEVALDPSTVTVLGRLPAFYIPPSRFWLHVVIARWDAPHPLVAAEAEVAEVLLARVSALCDPSRWRAVRMSTRGTSWAWELGDGHVLWGATAIATSVLLGLLDEGWSGGARPEDLGPDRDVQPWQRRAGPSPLPGPARLAGTQEWSRADLARLDPDGSTSLDPDAVGRAGEVVADAVARLAGGGEVVVLAGPGRTGAVGRAACDALRSRGVAARVVAGLGDGALPEAGVVVDALVGRALDGPLRGEPLALARALQVRTPLVVAVDLPSGLHPTDGLVGELITADVTLALGRPAPGVFRAGLGPFLGDLYVAPLRDDLPDLVRLVAGPDEAGWRE